MELAVAPNQLQMQRFEWQALTSQLPMQMKISST
jgi:hypothetical protein